MNDRQELILLKVKQEVRELKGLLEEMRVMILQLKAEGKKPRKSIKPKRSRP
jgi:hypothetical protein